MESFLPAGRLEANNLEEISAHIGHRHGTLSHDRVTFAISHGDYRIRLAKQRGLARFSSRIDPVEPSQMAKEGYLVFHEGMEGRRAGRIYYCVLGAGRLQLFSKRDSGVLVREIQLTKSKLKIRGVPDHEARHCPFSFSVVVHHSKIVDGRQVVYGKPSNLLISAPSWAERKSWGNAIHSWQRNYWGEPEHRLSIKEDDDVEPFFEEQRRSLESALERAASVSTVSVGSTTPTHAGSGSGGSGSGRRSFFSRAPSIKKMGSNMRKKISSASVTISLPPIGINITSSLQQLRPQQQQSQAQAAAAH